MRPSLLIQESFSGFSIFLPAKAMISTTVNQRKYLSSPKEEICSGELDGKQAWALMNGLEGFLKERVFGAWGI